MIKRIVNIYTILFIVLSISINNIKAQSQHYNSDDKSSLVDEYYYKAITLMNTGDYNEAWSLLKYCQIIDSTNAPVNYALAEVYNSLNDENNSFRLLKKAYELSPKNEEYTISYSDALLKRGKSDEAKSILSKLIEEHPDNEAYLERLAMYNLRSGDIRTAISIYSKLQKLSENIPSEYERYTVTKMRIYKAVNDNEGVIKELYNLVFKYPNNREYLYTLLGNLVNDKEYHSKAQNVINTLKRDTATVDAGIFYQTLLYINKGNTELAINSLNRFIALKNASTDRKIELLRYLTSSISNDKNKVENIALPIFNKLEKLYSNNSKLLLYYASTLKDTGNIEGAFEKANKAISIEPKSKQVYESAIQLFLNEDDIKYCARLCKDAIDNGFREPQYYLWYAIPLSEENKEKEAIDILLSGLNTPDFNSSQRSMLLGVVGDLYSSLDNKEKSIEYYEKALEEFPDNISVSNNYAYMLAEIPNSDLQKAERLAANAVRLRQNDPNNLDTYAWIFYKKGNYTLARLYISRALDNSQEDGASAVVLDHAGDIYRALKDWQKAISYYESSIKTYSKDKSKDNTKDIERVRNKINQLQKQSK